MEENLTYKRVFDSTSNGVIATDAKGIVILINQRAANIIGLKKKEVIGAKITEALPLTGELVIKCLQTGRSQLGRHIYGKWVNLVVNVTPVRQGRKLIGTVSNFQKMQQFENAAKQLKSYKQLNEQLRTIFNSSSDGIWVYDGDGKLIDINNAAGQINDIKEKDVIGKTYSEIVGKGIIPKSVMPEILDTKRQISIVSYGVKRQFTKLITGTPVIDENRNVKLVVINERDMTKLNMVKDQLVESRMITEKFKEELAGLSLLELNKQEIIAESKDMRQVITIATKISMMEVSNILILGESGTGKGLLAKFIHHNSKRREKPFIQINCAALPESLLEAELFGYEKGAFTGAREEGKAGLFEVAHEGTLFLDEIGDLPFSIQAKLLKYLDDQEVMRLGGLESKKIDCTIIAATNRNLETQVKQGRFRQDLFFRLETFTLAIPALRERPDDIFELANYFLGKYNKEYRKRRRISANAMNTLLANQYPGNVRQLKNALKMAVVMSETDVIDELLQKKLASGVKHELNLEKDSEDMRDFNKQMLSFEKEILKRAMNKYKSTRQIARYLNISKSTVARKMQKHCLG